MSTNANDNSNTPSLTEKIKQLDQAVEWFYGDDFKLDQALAKYQDATELAATIDQDLTKLKNQVEVVEDFTKD